MAKMLSTRVGPRYLCFLLVPHAEKGTLTDMEQEELMMLVPPLFSIKDIPEETVYGYLPS